MFKGNPRVSLVILNWNRKKDTLDCLESISKLRAVSCYPSVIVVDNASNDGSQASIRKSLIRLKKRLNWSFEFLENSQNLGFAAGNNVGIKHAVNHNADFVMVLNNDTLVHKDLLASLLDTMSRDKKAGLVSPKIYFAKGFEFHKERYKKGDLGRVIWYAGGTIDWNNIYGSNRGVDEVDVGQYDDVVETDFATGACMMIRVEVIKQVGMFDEKYFMYFEDADLSMRAKRKDWRVLYDPKAILWHKVSQSSGIGSALNDYFITRNRLLFGARYASVRTRFSLYKESLRLFQNGREWQRRGVVDFYLRKFGRGSWNG